MASTVFLSNKSIKQLAVLSVKVENITVDARINFISVT